MKKTLPRNRVTKPRRARRVADLELRRTPLQARGQATFERILEVTAGLLEERGAEALTTNHIARAAGINVATLYQYFPNKQAVLLALFESQTAHRSGLAEGIVRDLGTAQDWRKVVDAAVDAVVEQRRTMRGVLPLRQAMRSNPQLLEFDRKDTIRASGVLAEKLAALGGVARSDADLIARCTIEVVSALLDVWLIESGGRDDRFVGQAKDMVRAYLAPYFDPPAPRATNVRRKRR